MKYATQGIHLNFTYLFAINGSQGETSMSCNCSKSGGKKEVGVGLECVWQSHTHSKPTANLFLPPLSEQLPWLPLIAPFFEEKIHSILIYYKGYDILFLMEKYIDCSHSISFKTCSPSLGTGVFYSMTSVLILSFLSIFLLCRQAQ